METNSTTMMSNDINTDTASSSSTGNDDDPFMVLSYSISEIKAFSYLYYLTPPISLVGSCLLLYAVREGRKDSLRHLKTPFLRLLCGFAILDVIQSAGSLAFGPWSVPKDTPYVWNASGTIATCNANGFITNLLLGLVLYSACHASYSALTIYFQWRDEFIGRFIEPFFHVIVWGTTVTSGLLMVFQGMMNPVPSNIGTCWSSDYPPDCTYKPDVECLRGAGKNHTTQAFVLIGGAVVGSFIVIIISFWLIHSKVRQQEEKMNQWSERSFGLSGSSHSIRLSGSSRSESIVSGGGQSNDSSFPHSRRFKSLSDKVGNQALAYICAFLICNMPLLISGFGPRYGVPYATTYYRINSIAFEVLTPLQGAFNALIFFYNNQGIFRRGGPLYFLNRIQKRLSLLYCCFSNKQQHPKSIIHDSRGECTKAKNKQQSPPNVDEISSDCYSFESFFNDGEENSRVDSVMASIESPESSTENQTTSHGKSCPGHHGVQKSTRQEETERKKTMAATISCKTRGSSETESLPLECIRLSDCSIKTLLKSSGLTNPSDFEPIPESRSMTKFAKANREGFKLFVDVRAKLSSEEESSSEECTSVKCSLGSILQISSSSNPDTGSHNSIIDDEGSLVPTTTTTTAASAKLESQTIEQDTRRNDSVSICSCVESSLQDNTQCSIADHSGCSTQNGKTEKPRNLNPLIQYWTRRHREHRESESMEDPEEIEKDLERGDSSASIVSA